MIIGDAWEVYTYTYGEGFRALISFDHNAGTEDEHRGHPHCRRVIVFVPAQQVTENGLPVREALEQLGDMEDSLIARLEAAKVDCRFVGRMTYGGMRDFVFQVEDVAAFTAQVDGWKREHSGWRIESREREGWSFFDEKVRPSEAGWQQIADRRVLDGLRDAGSDMSKPHVLEHFFKGPPEALAHVAEQLRGDGFEGVPDDEGGLMMSRAEDIDLDEISQLTSSLARFCKRIGVEYTGWGAAVVR